MKLDNKKSVRRKNKKKKRKGFTTVELIAVLVILAIVTVFAFPSVRKIYYNNKNKEYYVYENMMIEYAKAAKVDTSKSCIYLKDLNIEGLDPEKGCNNGYVKTDGDEYKAFIQCNEYTTGTLTPDNNNFSKDEGSNCYEIACNRFEIDNALKIDSSTKSFDKCCHIYDGQSTCDLTTPKITPKDSTNFYAEGWQGESSFIEPEKTVQIKDYKVYHSIIKEKIDSTCPEMGDFTGTFDDSNHSIAVSGGTGGTLKYSFDNKTWTGSKLTIKDAESKKIYVMVEGDYKHKSVTCGYKTVTINKANAICPTTTAYSGTYNGAAHSVSINGGVGGTIQYSTDNTNWTTTNPTRIAAGTQTTYIRVVGDKNHNDVSCPSKTITINKADAVCPTTTAYSGTYNGSAHSISVSGGSGGTIQYSSDNSSWSTTNPTRTAAGTQTTYIRVIGDSNHNNVSCPSKAITINKADAICPTTTAYTGTYNGATHSISISGGSGGTIQYSSDNSSWSTTNPTRINAGTQTTYVRVAGDSNHNTVNCTSRAITINKANATCPTTTAYTGTYNGAAHSISISGGSGGTIQYSTDNSNWSGTNPSRTSAGSQTTYVRIVGDSNHNTVNCTSRAITINKANATCPTTTAYTGTYNGSAHSITISGGSGGTVQYSTDNSNWSTANPTRTSAGSQTTYVKIVGDSNHNTVTCTSRTITINKADATCPTTTAYTGNYDASAHSISISGGSGGSIQYSSDNSNWGGSNPTRTSAGSQTTYVRVAGDSNHNTVNCTARAITINKVNPTCPTTTAYTGNYDGSSHSISVSGGAYGTIQYSTDNVNWSGSNPSRSSAGSQTTYVRMVGDANHSTISCTARAITINKVNASCPSSSYGYSGTYDGAAHSIAAAGASGGTIQYSTDNYNWSTSNPTRTDAGTQTTYVRVAGDSNHNTVNCTARDISISKANAVLSCSNQTYWYGNYVTGCSCSGGWVGGTYSAIGPGTYTASCTGDGNHNSPGNQNWSVLLDVPIVTYEVNTTGKKCGNNKYTGTVTFTYHCNPHTGSVKSFPTSPVSQTVARDKVSDGVSKTGSHTMTAQCQNEAGLSAKITYNYTIASKC